jgi:hypothetical protein
MATCIDVEIYEDSKGRLLLLHRETSSYTWLMHPDSTTDKIRSKWDWNSYSDPKISGEVDDDVATYLGTLQLDIETREG